MSQVVTSPRTGPLRGTLSHWRRVLARHYARLGPKSRQRRFMAALPDKSVRRIAERASPDIVLGVEAEGRIVGVLEVFRSGDDHAEIGISVEDAFRGTATGTRCFSTGSPRPRRSGSGPRISTFPATTAASASSWRRRVARSSAAAPIARRISTFPVARPATSGCRSGRRSRRPTQNQNAGPGNALTHQRSTTTPNDTPAAQAAGSSTRKETPDENPHGPDIA